MHNLYILPLFQYIVTLCYKEEAKIPFIKETHIKLIMLAARVILTIFFKISNYYIYLFFSCDFL